MKSINLNLIKISTIFVMGIKSLITIGISFIFSDFIISIQEGQVDVFYRTLMIFVLFIVFEFLFDLLAIKLRMKYVQKSMLNINSCLFDKDISSIKDVDMSSYSTKTELFVSNYLLNQIFIPYCIIQIIMAIIAYYIISPIYVVYMLFISGLMMVIPSLSAKKMSRLTKDYTDTSKGYIDFLNNIFAGRREINQYNVTHQYKQKHNDEIVVLFKKYEKYNTFLRYVNASSNSFFTIIFVGLQVISGFLILFGDMEFGLLFTAIQLMNFFSNPAQMLFESINKYNSIKDQVPDIKNYNIEKCYTQVDNLEFTINDKISINNRNYSEG